MTTDLEAALAVVDRLAIAMSEHDLESALSCFAPGADTLLFGTGSDERRQGQSELRAHFRRDFAQSDWLLLRWFEVGGRLLGDVATAWATGTISAGVRGERFETPARFTATLVSGSVGWQIVQGHLSFPATGQSEGQSWPASIERLVAELIAERPDLRKQAAPDGTVTLLFTDIVNSSEVMLRLGDLRWLEVLRVHNKLVEHCVAEHGGYVVKSLGDGFMIAFQSARRAVACALALQTELGEVDRDPDMSVRIGLHTGEVVKERDDFFGRHVTLAARIGAVGRGGQVLASALLRDLVDTSGEFAFVEVGETELRGFLEPVRLYEIRR